jgi:hypothetical protein
MPIIANFWSLLGCVTEQEEEEESLACAHMFFALKERKLYQTLLLLSPRDFLLAGVCKLAEKLPSFFWMEGM